MFRVSVRVRVKLTVSFHDVKIINLSVLFQRCASYGN